MVIAEELKSHCIVISDESGDAVVNFAAWVDPNKLPKFEVGDSILAIVKHQKERKAINGVMLVKTSSFTLPDKKSVLERITLDKGESGNYSVLDIWEVVDELDDVDGVSFSRLLKALAIPQKDLTEHLQTLFEEGIIYSPKDGVWKSIYNSSYDVKERLEQKSEKPQTSAPKEATKELRLEYGDESMFVEPDETIIAAGAEHYKKYMKFFKTLIPDEYRDALCEREGGIKYRVEPIIEDMLKKGVIKLAKARGTVVFQKV